MKVKRAIVGFSVITFSYLLLLIWLDSRNQVFVELPKLLLLLPTLIGLSFSSYLLRYLRWYWLLSRAGSKTKVTTGFLAYLAGFVFTATPGKLGELVRIRYLTPQGVPPWKVLAAFVYERAFDLIVVLFLSALAIGQSDIFLFVFCFVMIILSVLVFVVFNPAWLTRILVYLRFYRLKKLSRICITLRDGMAGCRIWLTQLDILVSIILGVLAWGLTSIAFIMLLDYFDVVLQITTSIAIYPLSMLAGAASMLPGGMGSTEVAIVAMLSSFGVSVDMALIVAIGIRVATLWFAILCGFVSMLILEYTFLK